MKSNRKSILIASLACIVGALLVYTFKWAQAYYFSASVWQIAQTFGRMGRYLDESYQFISVLIYAGAIVSIVLLIWNAYRVARPLMNGMEWAEEARGTKSGMIVSILFTILFIIFVYAADNGDISDASITLWPIVEIALCVASKVLLTKMDYGIVEATSKSVSVTAQKQEPIKNETKPRDNWQHSDQDDKDNQTEIIPITNYDPYCMIQPCQIVYSVETGEAALIIACYKDYHALEAIQVSFEMINVFGDVINTEKSFFQRFEVVDEGKRTFIQTEKTYIPELTNHIREIRSARTVISRVKATDDSIQLPTKYEESPLGYKELSTLKGKGINRDVVMEKDMTITADAWVCMCGRLNSNDMESCQRCHRLKDNKLADLLDEIEGVEYYKALMELLDERIESGNEELMAVKEKCLACRAYGLEVMKTAAKDMINNLMSSNASAGAGDKKKQTVTKYEENENSQEHDNTDHHRGKHTESKKKEEPEQKSSQSPESAVTPAFCHKCGATVEPDDVFCAKCGSKLRN